MAGTRRWEVPALELRRAELRMDPDCRKEVIAMIADLVLFILSALGIVAAGKEFFQRGRNLGLWGV
jgi:hypothetical protein